MCRYAMYGPYKDNYACFACRKVFRQTSAHELDKSEQENRHYRCPQCGETMKDMGHDFQAPKQTDLKQWKKVELLYRHGYTYHSCGCDGPGYRPATLAEAKVFVRKKARARSEGERLLQVRGSGK
ncbi:hypothetical protein [Paenibacillus xanthanilyticus]|uniref:Zinc ribbon domain-containing protein n=1 Tax=Paenibacillus xanthanilyticus TaxID=1783531 RepID=A0ABV8JXE8_9BACL